MLVGQRCYHRLITPRGALRGGEDEANFGLNLTEEIGRRSGPGQSESLRGRIEQELLKEVELASVEVSVTTVEEGATATYAIEVVGYTAAGPFTLVLAASEVTVELLGLKEGTPS
jgi:hypothetical protein